MAWLIKGSKKANRAVGNSTGNGAGKNTASSFTDITGLNVTLNNVSSTSAVRITLEASPSATNVGSFGPSNGTSTASAIGYAALCRNGTIIKTILFEKDSPTTGVGHGLNLGMGWSFIDDTPSAGTNTYKIQVKLPASSASYSFLCNYMRLVAEELYA